MTSILVLINTARPLVALTFCDINCVEYKRCRIHRVGGTDTPVRVRCQSRQQDELVTNDSREVHRVPQDSDDAIADRQEQVNEENDVIPEVEWTLETPSQSVGHENVGTVEGTVV